MARTRGACRHRPSLLPAALLVAGIVWPASSPAATPVTCTTSGSTCSVQVQLSQTPWSIFRVSQTSQGFRGATQAHLVPAPGQQCHDRESTAYCWFGQTTFRQDGSVTGPDVHVGPGLLTVTITKTQACGEAIPVVTDVNPYYSCTSDPSSGDWSGSITLSVELSDDVVIAGCRQSTQGGSALLSPRSCQYSFTTTGAVTLATLRFDGGGSARVSATPGTSCTGDPSGPCSVKSDTLVDDLQELPNDDPSPRSVNIKLIGSGTFWLHVDGAERGEVILR